MKTRAKHSAYTISFNSRNDLIVEILFLFYSETETQDRLPVQLFTKKKQRKK